MASKYKVRIDRHVRTHNYAQCCDCDKDWDLFNFPGDRYAMLKHVRETGHTVVRESAGSSYYRPVEVPDGKG